MFFEVALSEVTYKGKIVRGSKHNTINSVWRLGLKMFSSFRIKIQGTYLVGILIGLPVYTTEESWLDSYQRREIFLQNLPTGYDLHPTCYIKSTNKYFPGAEAVGCEMDCSRASNSEAKNARIYTSTSLKCLHFVHKENFTLARNTLVI